jgi:anti-sigma B factor antagonist
MAAAGPDEFHLDIRPDRERVVLAVRGELDMATVPRVREAIDQLRRDGWRSVVLDLSEVTFIDAQGLNLLLSIWRSARGDAWDFALRDGSPPVSRLLEVARLSNHFPRA